MQTFLPLDSCLDSLMVLDKKRLGKQRVETFQILNILLGRTTSGGWKNHPAVRMWKGYEVALQYYYNASLYEFECRGGKNIKLQKESIDQDKIVFPPWFGDKSFHDSHKSNLLRKDKVYYSQFGWNLPDNLPYIWPVCSEKENG